MLTHKWRRSRLGHVVTESAAALAPRPPTPLALRSLKATHRVAHPASAGLSVVREFGSAAGIPVLVLHGGPGSSCDPADDLDSFDLTKHRVFLYDQRGGRGNHGKDNDDNRGGGGGDQHRPTPPPYTWRDLVDDIDDIRRAILGPDERITLFGGSWGSTLALLYARSFPQFTERVVVFGVFLGTRWEQAGFYGDQAVADCGARGIRYLCRTGQTGLIGPSVQVHSARKPPPLNPRRWWSGATHGGFDGASAVLDAYKAAIIDRCPAAGSPSADKKEWRLLTRVWHVFESFRSVGAGTDRRRLAELDERMDDAVDHLIHRTGEIFVTGENARVAHAQCLLFPALLADVEASMIARGGGGGSLFTCADGCNGSERPPLPPVAIVQGVDDTCCDPAVAAFTARAIAAHQRRSHGSVAGKGCTLRLVDGASHSPRGNAAFVAALAFALGS